MNRYVACLLGLILMAVVACAPSGRPTQGSESQTFSNATVTPVQAAEPAVTPATATNPPTPPTVPSSPFVDAPTPAVPEVPRNSAQAMEQVARQIYEVSSAQQDIVPYLIGVMTAFGVPPLGTDDVAQADVRYKQGLPLIFLPQVAQMADAYSSGDLYTLDSFIAAANARGARQRGTDQPLTREYLTVKFASFAGKTQYESRQALPAFVLALGQERARRSPSAKPDSLWGDGGLDPLQTTLLLYSVSYAGAEPMPRTASVTNQPGRTAGLAAPLRNLPDLQSFGGHPIVKWVTGKLNGEVTGEVQNQIGLPLDKKAAAQVTLCASLILYGHKTEVTTSPDKIYHKDGSHPAETSVGVTVRFQDDYHSKTRPIDRWLIETLGNCDLPVQGLARDATLDWSVSEGLLKHGSYDVTQPRTDMNGTALATWRTVPETTPKELRGFNTQREAVGSAIVRVSGLVDGWDPLVKIVNLLRDTGAVGQARLSVIYYEIPAYHVNTVFGIYSKVPVTGDICALDKPFTLQVDGRNPSGGNYTGTFKFTPRDLSGGSWVHEATSCVPDVGCGEESGSSTYQVESIAEGKPVLKMNATTGSSAVKGYVGVYDWPAWQIELKPATGGCSAE